MTEKEISEVVSRVLRSKFPASGFIGADVMSDADYDGTPIIKVLAHFEKRTPNPDGSAGAIHDIRTALLNNGEERFVFLANDYRDHLEEHEEDVG